MSIPETPPNPPSAVAGYCVICSYDLRTDPSGRCPECGTSFEDRQRLLRGRSIAAARRTNALTTTLGVIALIPWLMILTFLMLTILMEWLT